MPENDGDEALFPGGRLGALRGDCARCAGLCCAALCFSASEDFPVDKRAGQPCRHLRPDFRCAIHPALRAEGYKGCTVYDCFGAGQQISQVTFGGIDWRRDEETAARIFDAFLTMRRLYEMMWYLTQVLTYERARPVHGAIREKIGEIERMTRLDDSALRQADMGVCQSAGGLIDRASELVRAGARPHNAPAGKLRQAVRRGDLIGARLSKADLRRVSLRGALMIAADLRGADLTGADLIGADLRDADIRGTDLRGGLFLTQPQISAAKGDEGTKLPSPLKRPAHWGA